MPLESLHRAAPRRNVPVTFTLCRMEVKRSLFVSSHAQRFGFGAHLIARWRGTSRARWAHQTHVACWLSAALALRGRLA